MFDLLTVGYLARDFIYRVDEFPKPHEEVYAKSFQETHGGSCGHVAAYASYTFGLKCGLRSIIGDDLSGTAIVNRLRDRDRVDVQHVVVIRNGLTPTITLVTNNKAEKKFYTYPGCVVDIDTNIFIRDTPFNDTDFIYVAPCHPNLAFKIIEVAHRENKTVAYNPGTALTNQEEREAFKDILSFIDYLILNKAEAQTYSLQESLSEVLDFYFSRKAQTLVITDAENGSIVANCNGGAFFVPAYEVREIEALGGGDAYASAFVSIVCKENDLKTAALRGTQLGAYVVTRYGAREDVPSLKGLLDFCNKLNWRTYNVEPYSAILDWPIEQNDNR